MTLLLPLWHRCIMDGWWYSSFFRIISFVQFGQSVWESKYTIAFKSYAISQKVLYLQNASLVYFHAFHMYKDIYRKSLTDSVCIWATWAKLSIITFIQFHHKHRHHQTSFICSLFSEVWPKVARLLFVHIFHWSMLVCICVCVVWMH